MEVVSLVFVVGWGRKLLLVSLFGSCYYGVAWSYLFLGLILSCLGGVSPWLVVGFLFVGVPLVCWLPLVVVEAFFEEGVVDRTVYWAEDVVGWEVVVVLPFTSSDLLP